MLLFLELDTWLEGACLVMPVERAEGGRGKEVPDCDIKYAASQPDNWSILLR